MNIVGAVERLSNGYDKKIVTIIAERVDSDLYPKQVVQIDTIVKGNATRWNVRVKSNGEIHLLDSLKLNRYGQEEEGLFHGWLFDSEAQFIEILQGALKKALSM